MEPIQGCQQLKPLHDVLIHVHTRGLHLGGAERLGSSQHDESHRDEQQDTEAGDLLSAHIVTIDNSRKLPNNGNRLIFNFQFTIPNLHFPLWPSQARAPPSPSFLFDGDSRQLHNLAMRIRQGMAFCGLLGVLLVSTISASAEEKPLTGLQTLVSSTTISGYVDTSASWNTQPAPPARRSPIVVRNWLRVFWSWLRFRF